MVHEIIFNHANGSSKKLRTSASFERWEKNQKGKIVSNVLEDLILDENTVRPLKSVSITSNDETRLKFFKSSETVDTPTISLGISKKDYIRKVLNDLGQTKTRPWETVLLFN